VIQGISDQVLHITPFLATNKCGSYGNKWTYKGYDNDDGHLLENDKDLIKVYSQTGSKIVS
jgi:hypothetical protein